ncbi:MAG TPA: hypothetical protein DCF68_21455, partial [Cyanothece sp. UBA12306]|nr:hypothetical protein [Cyanothece sp. UBA12306]
YAAAWQLGQLLTIKNKKLAVSLFNWKRANAQKLAQNNQQALFPHIFTPNQLNNNNDLEFPPDIQTWFRELGLLYHIPFNYLVPDEQMLPLESIRFFWLDWFWVECLLDGAFSIGRVQNSDVEQDEKTNPLNRQPQTITGFLLRSEVVSGWPDLQIDGSNSLETGDEFIPLEQRLKLLRCDRLSHNVLLCLFAGEIKTVDIYLKPEGLNFGFNEDKNNNFSRQLRDLQGNEQSDWKINPIPFRNQAKNVINITALIEEIEAELNNQAITFAQFTSAQFALQMIQGAEKVRFSAHARLL